MGSRSWRTPTPAPTSAIADEARGFYGVQFHPEVNHTRTRRADAPQLPLSRSAAPSGDWTMGDYCRRAVEAVRDRRSAKGKVLLALSGGVDSSVAAALLAEAIGQPA